MKNILKLSVTILGFGILASCSSGQKKEETKTTDKPAKAIEVSSSFQPKPKADKPDAIAEAKSTVKSLSLDPAGLRKHDGAADLARWSKRPPKQITEREFVDHVCDLYATLDASQDGMLKDDEVKKLPAWLGLAGKTQVTIQDVVTAAKAKFKASAKTNPKLLSIAEYSALVVVKK